MDTFVQLVGLASSILGILAFFGFARYADLQGLFDQQEKTSRHRAGSKSATSPNLRRIVPGVIAGSVAQFAAQCISSPAFQLIVYGKIVGEGLLQSFVFNIIVSGIFVSLGSTVRRPILAAISGFFGTVIIHSVFVASQLEAPGLLLVINFFAAALAGMIAALVGAAGETSMSAMIGALGGAFLGFVHGVLFGFGPAVALVFVHVLAGAVFGGIAGSILQRSAH